MKNFSFFKIYRLIINLLSILFTNKFNVKNNVIMKKRHEKIFQEVCEILKITDLETKKITSFDTFANFRKEIKKILNNSNLLSSFLKNIEIQKIMFGTNRFFFF